MLVVDQPNSTKAAWKDGKMKRKHRIHMHDVDGIAAEFSPEGNGQRNEREPHSQNIDQSSLDIWRKLPVNVNRKVEGSELAGHSARIACDEKRGCELLAIDAQENIVQDALSPAAGKIQGMGYEQNKLQEISASNAASSSSR
jgi:hypothetical protein